MNMASERKRKGKEEGDKWGKKGEGKDGKMKSEWESKGKERSLG